ncbi:hypothetical protein DSO57_1008618 [Entomophthora muscae]|uniref:Uncharacterized protein n=1 Tax=Entomophthora muscae TaxID=34485 RepID=A0ACC2RY40_9FUNG|nr:hypothetical protein DSO57_1008618 [Entomophthora muscae]
MLKDPCLSLELLQQMKFSPLYHNSDDQRLLPALWSFFIGASSTREVLSFSLPSRYPKILAYSLSYFNASPFSTANQMFEDPCLLPEASSSREVLPSLPPTRCSKILACSLKLLQRVKFSLL